MPGAGGSSEIAKLAKAFKGIDGDNLFKMIASFTTLAQLVVVCATLAYVAHLFSPRHTRRHTPAAQANAPINVNVTVNVGARFLLRIVQGGNCAGLRCLNSELTLLRSRLNMPVAVTDTPVLLILCTTTKPVDRDLLRAFRAHAPEAAIIHAVANVHDPQVRSLNPSRAAEQSELDTARRIVLELCNGAGWGNGAVDHITHLKNCAQAVNHHVLAPNATVATLIGTPAPGMELDGDSTHILLCKT